MELRISTTVFLLIYTTVFSQMSPFIDTLQVYV